MWASSRLGWKCARSTRELVFFLNGSRLVYVSFGSVWGSDGIADLEEMMISSRI